MNINSIIVKFERFTCSNFLPRVRRISALAKFVSSFLLGVELR